MTQVMSTENFLEHHGVKGMKWGVHKESRKVYRQRVRQEKSNFEQKKAHTLLNEAAKGGDKVLIKTRFGSDTTQRILTGKEFVDALSRGGAFDVRVSEVYATRGKTGPYVLNDKPIGTYKKTKRQ